MYRVPVVEKNIQGLISPLIGSLDRVSSTKPKTKSFNIDNLQKTFGYQTHNQSNQTS